MNDDEKLSHEYDGIEENDNPMPRWWVLSFILTVVFAAIYLAIYYFFGGLRIEDQYADNLAAHARLVEQIEKTTKNTMNDVAVSQRVDALTHDTAALAAGKAHFATRCASCHGDVGQGLIGPNLTDDYWLNGDGKPASVAKIITAGVDGKGMPAWKGLLSDEQILQVTAFVRTLLGTKPPNPKAPQGVLNKP